MTAGIYEIVNSFGGKRYVGQAVRIERRCAEHFRLLRRGEHKNRHLQAAFSKLGEVAFSWRVIEAVDLAGLCADEARTLLAAREQFHIDQTPIGAGYQLAPVAGSTLGVRYSAEARAKLSAIKLTPEARARTSAVHKGKRVDPLAVAKMAAALVGRTLTAEHRANIRSGFTAEGRARIAAANRRREHSPETRAKLAAASKRVGPEGRERVRQAWLGRKHSPETLAKMSVSARAREERRRAMKASADAVLEDPTLP